MGYIDLCQPCHDAQIETGSHCYCCAKQFPSDGLTRQLCGSCLKNPPAFDNTYAPYTHQGAIRYLINQCKFNGTYKNTRVLGLLLANYLRKQNVTLPELIIPVPLHPKRYRQRGFNQTLEIAKIITRELSIPIDNDCCQRIKNTDHQISLTAKQRQQNIKGAFQAIKTPNARHIAILDDVMTTGATTNELAKTLRETGVSQIDIWVCARAT